jgi:hypothetical protein
MNEILSLVFLVLPYVLAAVLPLLGVTWVVVGSRVTWIWVGVYYAALFYFPNASWGLVESGGAGGFYTRGTGQFYFSLINLILFGLALQALAARAWKATVPVEHNLGWPALLLWLVFAGNVLVGNMIDSVRWFEIIGYSGLLNVVNFTLAFYVLMSCVREPRDLDRVINVLLFCAVTRGLWGALRFVALGGDPANFYANFQQIDVKLTFFDINDALVATLALFLVAWRLATEDLALRWRLIYGAVAALELFIVIFSYRRTAWLGFGMAALLFSFCRGRATRNKLLLGYLVIGLPAIMYKMIQRSGTTQGGSLLERLFPDIVAGGSVSFTTGRFAELYAAFLSLKASPWLGLGTWGQYSGFRFSELAWHHGDFGWMHSAVLHMALKAGVLGSLIWLLTLAGMIRYVRRHKDAMPSRELGVMMAGLAGVLFMLPNWLGGTPIIEYRTMQLMAFTFALPYMAHAVVKRSKGAPPCP